MVCFIVLVVVVVVFVGNENDAKNVNKVSHLCCDIKKLSYKGMTSLRPFLLCGYAFLDATPPLWGLWCVVLICFEAQDAQAY